MKEHLEKTLDYIVQFKKEHDGCAPSVREMGIALGISYSVAARRLAILEKAGTITRFGSGHAARNIMLTASSGAFRFHKDTATSYSWRGDPRWGRPRVLYL